MVMKRFGSLKSRAIVSNACLSWNQYWREFGSCVINIVRSGSLASSKPASSNPFLKALTTESSGKWAADGCWLM